MRLCAFPCLAASHCKAPRPTAELLLPPPRASSSKLPVFSSSPSSWHGFPVLVYQLYIEKLHSRRAHSLKRTRLRKRDPLKALWGPLFILWSPLVSNSAEEHRCCGIWCFRARRAGACVGRVWRDQKAKMLEKEGLFFCPWWPLWGYVYYHRVICSFVSRTGLNAFRGLGNQWYFGLHFTSCIFFFLSACTK